MCRNSSLSLVFIRRELPSKVPESITPAGTRVCDRLFVDIDYSPDFVCALREEKQLGRVLNIHHSEDRHPSLVMLEINRIEVLGHLFLVPQPKRRRDELGATRVYCQHQ